MDLDYLQSLIADYGIWFYAVTFLWTFIEGETFVIYAGVLVAQGLLDGPWLLACAWLGSFCGDQCYFYIGRFFGPGLLRRFPRWQRHVDTANDWLQRYDTVFILTFRWIYGVRNFASFALGMSRTSWYRFLGLNFIAAGIWAIGFAGGGFLLGTALRPVLDQVAPYFTLAMLGVFAFMFSMVYLAHRIQKRRHAARTALAPAAVLPPPPLGVSLGAGQRTEAVVATASKL